MALIFLPLRKSRASIDEVGVSLRLIPRIGIMSRRALIVEDEMELGELLAEHLRAWGFESTVLNEGKNAVAWVRQHQPDLILLDLLLPDTDGYTICETLKLD